MMSLDEPSHASQCLLNIGQGGCVATAHVAFAQPPEQGAGHNDNLFFLEEIFGELV